MKTPTCKADKEEQHDAYTVSSRRWIADGSDVYVKEFRLAIGEAIPWHHHSRIFDVFYCIEGQLTVERADVFTGERSPDLVLDIGDSAKVDVGTAHRPVNSGPGQCRFVIIQGVGPYDYISFDPAAVNTPA